MARTRSQPISPGKELSLEKVTRSRRASPQKKPAVTKSTKSTKPTKPTKPAKSTKASKAKSTKSTAAKASSPAPTVTSQAPSSPVAVTDGQGSTSPIPEVTNPIPSIEEDDHLESESTEQAPEQQEVPVASVLVQDLPQPQRTQWLPFPMTAWIVSWFSFLPAIGSMDLIQQLTVSAEWFSRINPVRHHTRRRRTPPRSPAQNSGNPLGNRKDSPAKSTALDPRSGTPIKRGPRTSYTAIANRRRTEANGPVTQTLFRVSDLVAANAAKENGTDNIANVDGYSADTNPSTANEIASNSNQILTTTNQAAEESQSAADADQPRGWSRWIFNSVSRRWTSIRDRLAPHGAEAEHAMAPEADITATPEQRNSMVLEKTAVTKSPVTAKPVAALEPAPAPAPWARPTPPFARLMRAKSPSKYRKRSLLARKSPPVPFNRMRTHSKPYQSPDGPADAPEDPNGTHEDLNGTHEAHDGPNEIREEPNETREEPTETRGDTMDISADANESRDKPNEIPDSSKKAPVQSDNETHEEITQQPKQWVPPPNTPEEEQHPAVRVLRQKQRGFWEKREASGHVSPDYSYKAPNTYGLTDEFYDPHSSEDEFWDLYDAEQELTKNIKKRKAAKAVEPPGENPSKRRKHVLSSTKPPSRTTRYTRRKVTNDLSPVVSEGDPSTPHSNKQPTAATVPTTTPAAVPTTTPAAVPITNPHGTFVTPGYSPSDIEMETAPSTEQPSLARQATPYVPTPNPHGTFTVPETSDSSDAEEAAPMSPHSSAPSLTSSNLHQPKTPSRLREVHRASLDSNDSDFLLRNCPGGILSDMTWPKPSESFRSRLEKSMVDKKLGGQEEKDAVNYWLSMMP